ncbi:hypothetical protein V1512DRAFT_247473 [Lipomyces arxii]|uniref:uncharacterized protein n=1 Tax=Lipomyces arxii TaxID=56418 RepID=UPI0034CE5B02
MSSVDDQPLNGYQTYNKASLLDRLITLYSPESFQGVLTQSKDRTMSILDRFVYFLYTGITYRLFLPVIIVWTAISSCAVIYPILGIFYFAFHPILWWPLATVIIPMGLTFAVIMIVWSTIAYPPQAAILVFSSGPFGLISSAYLVISQSMSISQTVTRLLFLRRAMRNTFDGVLRLRGYEDLINNPDMAEDEVAAPKGPMANIAKIVSYKLLASWRKLYYRLTSPYIFFKSLVLFPISFIPIVGPFIVSLVKSTDTARKLQRRYFKLKGFTRNQARVYTRRRYGAYLTFGIVAGFLQTLPLIGMFFMVTNTVGSALWAARMEKKTRRKSADYD